MTITQASFTTIHGMAITRRIAVTQTVQDEMTFKKGAISVYENA